MKENTFLNRYLRKLTQLIIAFVILTIIISISAIIDEYNNLDSESFHWAMVYSFFVLLLSSPILFLIEWYKSQKILRTIVLFITLYVSLAALIFLKINIIATLAF
jgi:hypothetical protein